MSDAINKACAVLREAAATFRDYADHHRAKSGEPGDVRYTKARRNDEIAAKCEAAHADLRMQASGTEREG